MNEPWITSRRNQRVIDVVKLRDRRGRKKQGRIVIDGIRELNHALRADVDVVEAFLCPELLTRQHEKQLVERLRTRHATLWRVTPAVFAKLAFGDRAEGVVAVAAPPQQSLEGLQLPDNPLVVVLEGLEKPGNLGAVVRSADAAGVSAVIVADGQTDLFNPAAIRASVGTIFAVGVCEASTPNATEWLGEKQLQIVVTRPDADRLYTELDYTRGTAVVLGSEAAGLSSEWERPGYAAVRLPMLGAADSLNIAATAAALFYEALRQRTESRESRVESREPNK